MSTKKRSQRTSEQLVGLKLTKKELRFLYRLSSVYVNESTAVSELLAHSLKCTKSEQTLVNKIIEACKRSGIPAGQSAPDFLLVPNGIVPLGIVQAKRELTVTVLSISPGELVYVYELKRSAIILGLCTERITREKKDGKHTYHTVKLHDRAPLALEDLKPEEFFWTKDREAFTNKILSMVKEKLNVTIDTQTASLNVGENDPESDNLTCAKTTRSPRRRAPRKMGVGAPTLRRCTRGGEYRT